MDGLFILWCHDCGFPVQHHQRVKKIYCLECRRLVKKGRWEGRMIRLEAKREASR